MNIEQFASLRVELERGATLDSVLEREGLTRLQWMAHERRWLRALVESARRGDRTLSSRYAAAFEQPLAAAATREAAQPAHPAAGVPVPVAAAPIVPPPAVPASMPVAAAPPAAVRSVEETSFVGVVALPDALPFRDDPDAAPPPSVSTEMLAESHSMVGETSEVGVLSAADLAAAMPFAHRAVGADDGAPTPTATSANPPQTDTDATGFVPYVKPGPTLGFQAVPDKRPPPPAAAKAFIDGAELVGETAEVGVLTADDLAAALPFGKDEARSAAAAMLPDPATLPAGSQRELTLEQYASLRCDLDRGVRKRSEVLAGYGIDGEDALSRVNHAWAARFRDDPTVYGQFRAAYDRYSSWLGSQGSG